MSKPSQLPATFRFTVLQLILVMLGFAISAAIIGRLMQRQNLASDRTIRRDGAMPEIAVDDIAP
ncbi:hypothetical protein NA78x_005370 [Anatilimnocola sp. NA78]|uniref:hypothetical protein n=1 Tax=Anatilimnocola sp. NA78 TaxID=3415683 RepID=UPI003CE51C66